MTDCSNLHLSKVQLQDTIFTLIVMFPALRVDQTHSALVVQSNRQIQPLEIPCCMRESPDGDWLL